MKSKTIFKVILLLFITITTSCVQENNEELLLNEVIEAIKSSFAPDKRVALFSVDAVKNGSSYVLSGESNLPDAVAELKSILKEKKISFIDEIAILPGLELEGKTQGVIRISVANLRSKPKHSAELGTQATLGTPVKVLKKEGDWFLIQTPDAYLAWVDVGGIQLMDAQTFTSWKKANKIIYTKTSGYVFETTAQKNRVSDIVAGSILEVLSTDVNFSKVIFPDKRVGFIANNELQNYTNWSAAIETNLEALVSTSKTLMGVPYLWGGTSTKGVDCSGFTKTIYFLNGLIIPRDASQQVHTGVLVDTVANFTNLQKGDLLFFGRKATDSLKEKVVHVGMWIGNNKFIHASDMVRISSFDKDDVLFDAFNLNRYLKSKRIVNQKEDNLISLKEAHLFKD